MGQVKIREVFYVILTLVLLLLFAEGGIRLFSLLSQVYDLEMTKYAMALKRPSRLPGVSHEHIPHARATLMGQEVALNSLGHRSPELSNPKPATEKRLHFMGNSMMLGWGSALEFTIPMLTAQELQAKGKGGTFVAINAGIGNFNAIASAQLFASQVDQVQPDLVVMQYYVADVVPTTIGVSHFLLRHSLLASFSSLKFRSIWILRDETLAQYYEKHYRPDSPALQQTLQAIGQVKKLCSERKIPLVVLFLPEMHDFSANGPYPALYATIAQFFAKMAIPMVYTEAAMYRAFGNRPTAAWVAKDDPHPNREANMVIAHELVNYLENLAF